MTCAFESKTNLESDHPYFETGYVEIPPHCLPKRAPRFLWTCRCADCEMHEDIAKRTHGGPFQDEKAAVRDSERAIAKACGVERLKFIEGGELPSHAQH
jgi:hypothetical protein